MRPPPFPLTPRSIAIRQDYEEVTEDEDEYEDEDEDEEEEASAAAPAPVVTPAAAQAAAAAAASGEGQPAAKEWVGLQSMPAQTQQSLMEVLNRLREKGQEEMTVMFVGKQGTGKSSTLNSVLNERVRASAPFQPESLTPVLAARRAAGFTLTLLDTPGLLEGDSVSARGIGIMKMALSDARVKVHAVVYMDRLDNWRVDNSDRAIFKALAENFGWTSGSAPCWGSRTASSRRRTGSPPRARTHAARTSARKGEKGEGVRGVRRGSRERDAVGGPRHPQRAAPRASARRHRKRIPVRHQRRRGEGAPGPARHRVADQVRLSTLVDIATAKRGVAMAYDPNAEYASENPNKKHRLFILPLLALQVLVLAAAPDEADPSRLQSRRGGRV